MIEHAIDLFDKGFKIFPVGSPYVKIHRRFLEQNRGSTQDEILLKWCKYPLLNKWSIVRDCEQDIDQVEYLFDTLYKNSNIGIVTDGLCIVDADNQESVSWCDKNLPTGIKQTTGKGKQYFFRDTELKYKNSASKSGIDIRAQGGFVVAPESTHGSGKKYKWEIGTGIKFASIDDLPKMTDEIWGLIQSKLNSEKQKTSERNAGFSFSASAGIEQIDFFNPTSIGERNHTAAKLAGKLLSSGANQNEYLTIMQYWNANNCTPPLSEQEFKTTIDSIFARHEKQKHEKQYASLGVIKAETKEVIEQAKLWTHDKESKKPKLCDSVYTKLPPLLAEMLEHINRQSIKEQPVLALASLFPLFGTVLGQKVKMEGRNLRTNIYTVGVGETGCGKNASLKAVKNSLYDSDIDKVCVEGFASDAGFLRRIKEKPSSVAVIDEFGAVLQSMTCKNAPKYLRNIVNELLTLYSQSDSVYHPKHLADSGQDVRLIQPNISLYGVTTPRSLYKAFTSDTVEGGLLSRIMLFDTNGHYPLNKRPEGELQTPRNFVEFAKLWEKSEENQGGFVFEASKKDGDSPPPKPKTIYFEDEATLLFFEAKTLEMEKRQRSIADKYPNEGYAGLFVRVAENAGKLALIFAGSRSIPENLSSITKEDIELAFQISEYCAETMLFIAMEQIADNDNERNLKQVLAMVRKAGERGMTKRELRRNSICRRLDTRQFEDVLHSLQISEEITLIDTNEGKRGRPRNAFVAIV